MIRALHRKVRRLEKVCMADRPAHEILAFMLHGLAATADEAGCEVLQEKLRQLRAERGPQAAIESPPAVTLDPEPATAPALASSAGPVSAPARKQTEPPLQIPDLSDPSQSWQFVINRPPPGPRPPPPPPYRDPLDDPLGLYGEPTGWR